MKCYYSHIPYDMILLNLQQICWKGVVFMLDFWSTLSISVMGSVIAYYIVNVRLRLTPPVTYVPYAVRSA